MADMASGRLSMARSSLPKVRAFLDFASVNCLLMVSPCSSENTLASVAVAFQWRVGGWPYLAFQGPVDYSSIVFLDGFCSRLEVGCHYEAFRLSQENHVIGHANRIDPIIANVNQNQLDLSKI